MMTDILKFKSVLIEKQELILNRLTLLDSKELMHLVASLSSLISNLDLAQAEEEIRCNRVIVSEMKLHRTSFARAESVLKSSDTYFAYKNVLNLKQCAVRSYNLAKMQAQYVLSLAKANMDEDISAFTVS